MTIELPTIGPDTSDVKNYIGSANALDLQTQLVVENTSLSAEVFWNGSADVVSPTE